MSTTVFVGTASTGIKAQFAAKVAAKVARATAMPIDRKVSVLKALLAARQTIQAVHGLADSDTAKELATIARLMDKTFRTVSV